jgi:hypothetical protein
MRRIRRSDMNKNQNNQERKVNIIAQYTCQKCGKAGYLRGIFDDSVLCDRCFAEISGRGLGELQEKELEAAPNEKILTRNRAENLTGEDIVIPEGYEEILNYTFQWLSRTMSREIKSISIPASVTHLDETVCAGCDTEVSGAKQCMCEVFFMRDSRLRKIALNLEKTAL